LCDKTTRNVALILRWDFNANIGKEHSNKRVATRHTLHDITNEDGETLVLLAIVHKLEKLTLNFRTEDSIRIPGKPLDRIFVIKQIMYS
jgi:hypothetical protein